MEFNPIRYFPNLAGSLNFTKDMRSGVSQPALTRCDTAARGTTAPENEGCYPRVGRSRRAAIAKLSRGISDFAADFTKDFSMKNSVMKNSVLPTWSGTQDFLDVQPGDSGGRFIVISSVNSCRSSADEIATVSNFPSGYVLASS